jgi:hypothetical protein
LRFNILVCSATTALIHFHKGQILPALSSAVFASFKKRNTFTKNDIWWIDRMISSYISAFKNMEIMSAPPTSQISLQGD